MNLPYRQIISLPKDFNQNRFQEQTDKLPAIARGIAAKLQSNEWPFLGCARGNSDITEMNKICADLRSFRNIVILGTGGSSLGGKTCYALAEGANLPDQPQLHFMDNVDPHSFSILTRRIRAEQTAIIAISKSGNTAETLCQLHVLAEWIGIANAAKQLVIITEPGDNILRRTGMALGAAIYDHNPKIGGRFSVLSNVGMLPAMLCGLNAEQIRIGAAAVLNHALSTGNTADCPAAYGAALHIALNKYSAVNQNVMMPYCDRLRNFASWWRQLWAESLGKGGHGLTPIDALGTVDQHSQLQLYLDGPKDKCFTLIAASSVHDTMPVKPIGAGDKKLDYLYGRTMGDLLRAEYNATAQTLKNKGLAVRSIEIPQLNEESLGALFMHFMLETVFAAELMGVDAFDQPAVEEGKILTRDYLSKMQPAA